MASPTSNLDLIRGRQVVVPLVNRTGADSVEGDVVVLDPANDGSYITTTTARDTRTIGVVQEPIVSLGTGRVLISGYAPIVNVAASVNRNDYVETSGVAKQVSGNAVRRTGSFGQFLKTSTTPDAVLWGIPDGTTTGGGGATSSVSGIPPWFMAGEGDDGPMGPPGPAGAGGTGGGGGSGGGVLGSTSYSTGSDAAWATVSSATATDIDATNAALTVTIPASGKVVVSVDLDVSFTYGAFPWGPGYLCIKNGSTVLQSQPMNFYTNAASDARYATVGGRYHATFALTGLTPGSMTLKVALRSDGTQSCIAYANDGAGGAGHYAGPFEMVVWDGTTTGSVIPGSVLLEQHTAAGVASLDFTSFISPTFDEYLFEVIDLLPVNNGVSFYMRVRASGAFVSAAKYATAGWAWIATSQASFGNGIGALAAQIATSNAADVWNGATGGVSGQVRLYNPQSTLGKKRISYDLGWSESASSGDMKGSTGRSVYADTLAIDGFQFLFSGGNIASGIVRVYGIPKT